MRTILAAVLLTAWAPAADAAEAGHASAPPGFRKVLFLGNSITKHGPKPDIGWTGNWGMAAGAQDRDFVHLVARGLVPPGGPAPEIMICNIAEFERQPAGYDAGRKLADATDFGADLVILAIGENVPRLESEEAKASFAGGLRALLSAVRGDRKPALVVRSCFWPDAAKDAVLKAVCREQGGIFADIGGLAADEANYARSERSFPHAGVAAHPGDRGMQAIAKAILDAIRGRRPGPATP